jgi:hypothetical protein
MGGELRPWKVVVVVVVDFYYSDMPEDFDVNT